MLNNFVFHILNLNPNLVYRISMCGTSTFKIGIVVTVVVALLYVCSLVLSNSTKSVGASPAQRIPRPQMFGQTPGTGTRMSREMSPHSKCLRFAPIA